MMDMDFLEAVDKVSKPVYFPHKSHRLSVSIEITIFIFLARSQISMDLSLTACLFFSR